MPPKKKDIKPAKGGDKPKGKGSASKADNDGGSSSKLKAATAINTRHILVDIPIHADSIHWLSLLIE